MRSGNGKHRRPRQAPALFVAAGVTGSAIAIPLLGATSASAADANTWDRVAECESGGMWSADLGNGHYGGLQFSQEKWQRYGGLDYAPRADLASRSQQIKVAEKVFAAEGRQAWPSCAVISGLAADGGSGSGSASGASGGVDAADPGTDASAPPKAPAGSVKRDAPEGGTQSPERGTPAASAGAVTPTEPTPGTSVTPSTGPSAGTGQGTPGAGNGATAGSADPSATADRSQDPGQGASRGKHRGEPAPENTSPESGSSVEPGMDSTAGASLDPSVPPGTDPSAADPSVTDGRESSRHASRGGGKAERSGGAPEPDKPYTVRAGDNLSHIADEAKVPGGWPALYEANRSAVGADPDLIRPGQNLVLGDATGTGQPAAGH
ncbi:LysM peptidoglycan-binding domain-containing protein [Streptomyces candidus]|uniref:LysM repeat protein n=1 Tax=Streptomyces candidus TaxID=67283 RepID=A0A7X0HFU0_9ACTN|nr:transglycosylase family protein [Streptomyces candidus]MBB6435398.1 LysM repeat protein [Streptomyces candidus]